MTSVADHYEKETADLMRKRIRAELYLDAAGLYKACPEIPNGEKYRKLAAPFKSYSPKRLHSLMVLPFSAVVTTNFDRSLHDAYYSLYSTGEEAGLDLQAPRLVELGDLSMKQAIYWTDFYIARIHGREEIPETMVLDRNDYVRIQEDSSYHDFLMHILKCYRCLFVGYSFLDPAIDHVLELMRQTLPRPYPRLHLALLPSDGDSRLRLKLKKVNIDIIEYDPDNEHEALWEAIRTAQREIRTAPREAPDKIEPIPGLTRLIATTYSRLKLGKQAEPLREIVVESIVAQIVRDSGPRGVREEDLIQTLKKYLSLNDDHLGALVNRAVEGLTSQDLCNRDKGVLTCSFDDRKPYDMVMEKLVQSVDHRLKVREGVTADRAMRESIAKILNQLFLTRGWDLGAHLAGGHPLTTFDATQQIQSLLKRSATDFAIAKSNAVANSIFDLLRHPDDKEAVLLTDVARIAFGVELVLNNAKSVVGELLFLPERIYLDASVLMPAIVQGHPYGPIYMDTIARMQSAAETAHRTISLLTARAFLNEIINHRSLAIREVQDQKLENVDKQQHHILLYGAQNTNVYIGAYSSWIGRIGEKISFSDFLDKVAPYGSEDGLADYLESYGIRTIELSFESKEEKDLYNRVKIALRDAYETAETDYPFRETKAKVLVDHEAAQLARLAIDMDENRKPLFVTADKRLMSACRGEPLETCGKAIISHLGLVQLVDLVLGLGAETDKRAAARLMWDVWTSDEKMIIRNYLIDLALQAYDEATAMAMWDAVDQIAEQAAAAARAERISMHVTSESMRARTAKFLDRFEQDFYAQMDKIIRAREQMSS